MGGFEFTLVSAHECSKYNAATTSMRTHNARLTCLEHYLVHFEMQVRLETVSIMLMMRMMRVIKRKCILNAGDTGDGGLPALCSG